MTYYLDNNFCLHLENKENYLPWEDSENFFKGKCKIFIEGYRVIPEDKTWTRDDGVVFNGFMISPCKDFEKIKMAQEGYSEAEATIEELDAALIEATYNNILLSLEV